jgi:hypothetical protein
MSWLAAATPTPTQTQGTTENAAWAGGTLLVFILAMVALVFLLAWAGKYRGRRRPAAPDPDKPLRPT